MDFLSIIGELAEQAIRKAQERGDFDNLPGRGKPLVFEDDSFVPPDLRMAYKILRNAGFVPPEIQQEKDIQRTIDLLESAPDEQTRLRQLEKLNLMVARINLGRRRPIQLEKKEYYFDKVVGRVRVAGQDED